MRLKISMDKVVYIMVNMILKLNVNIYYPNLKILNIHVNI